MPTFTPLPGDIVGAPPYRGVGCLTQVLFLKGDLAAQQRFCDLALNGPAGGGLTFRAVTDMVLVTGIYADSMGSMNDADRDKGMMQEWDVGFWTAVRGGRPGDEDNWQSYWLPSFLFVDSAAAMAAGREVFGYPKTAATFQDRGQDHDDPSATLVVQHFPRYGPGERPVVEPLVRVTLDDPGAHAPSPLQSIEAAWDIVKGVAPIHFGFPMPPLPGLPWRSGGWGRCGRPRWSRSPPPPATRSCRPSASAPPRSPSSASGSNRISRSAPPSAWRDPVSLTPLAHGLEDPRRESGGAGTLDG